MPLTQSSPRVENRAGGSRSSRKPSPFLNGSRTHPKAGCASGHCYSPAMPFGIGIWELLILLLVLLLVFGPKRLPEMGRQLGKGMREFKDSVSGKDDDDDPIDEVAQLPPAEPAATTTTTPARERDTVS